MDYLILDFMGEECFPSFEIVQSLPQNTFQSFSKLIKAKSLSPFNYLFVSTPILSFELEK